MSGVGRLRGRSRGTLLSVGAVVAVLVGAGAVAYACGQGGGCGGLHQPACPTPKGIFWVSYSTPLPSAPNVKCTISIDSRTNTLVEGASGLGPGQWCSYAAELKNTDDKIVSITERVTGVEPTGCTSFGYSDNIPSTPPPTISSDHSFGYHGKLSLSSPAPPACGRTGAVAEFYVVITAVPLTKCWY